MKFAVVLAATVLLMSPLAPQIATCQQQDSASKADYPPLVGSGSIVRFLVRGDRHVYSGPLSRRSSYCGRTYRADCRLTVVQW